MEKTNQKLGNEGDKMKQRDEAETREKLRNHETSVRHRVHCEERAFHIVNKLIDDAVEDSFLIQCGKMISREHYSDIVEERAISLLCGYPICRNQLGNIPKKKYHISTRSNKVFDISERKNFCSNQCLQASKYFQNQISESPIWCRTKEGPVEFQILSKSSIKGVIGDEVLGINPRTVLEEEISRQEEEISRQEEEISRQEDRQKTNTKTESPTSGKLSQKTANVTRKNTGSCVNKNSSVQERSEFISEDNAENSNVHIQENKDISVKLDRLSIDESVEAISASDQCVNPTSVNNSKQEQNDKTVQESKNLISAEGASITNDESHALASTDKEVIPLDSDDHDEKPKFNQKEGHTQENKMQRLLMLMSKKKNLLSEMADVQSLVVSEKIKQTCASENSDKIKARTKQTPNIKQKTIKKSKERQPATFSPLCALRNILKRWITQRTTEYLKRTDQLVQSTDLPGFSDPKVQSGYADLCRRLGAREKEMDTLIKETVGEGDNKSEQSNKIKGRLPDYEALKQEADVFLPKASEFITGKRAKDRVKETPEPNDVYIPTVDAYDQRQIRIRIVLDRLDKSLQDLLGALSLTVQDVSGHLRELIHTFCLEKDTIVFKPFEWTLVGLFILKMLSKKHPSISTAFSQASAQRYFTTLLSGIGQSMTDLDSEVQELVLSAQDIQ